ncbi:aspartate/glutamate racemase family protein [Rhodalgimonas zhirmunskyi]|uniref:Aspartate/glutamate racemase family protein n=1 Tax=Rhodalgimonas zhirmunskyi TaxID=2964767 RepID=A0AAJ1UAW4_9RHOB|nr:aspartate/glutamate racemase family protein [Rhodoalgimonas zhirmunskyi]MDQ2093191.1 aspartate/glutamate racemase family protein [Rhodoalgimonas zhirmunskyi]
MARGGKTVYGAQVGILMLETRFPRIPGDIGNALSFPFPVQYRVVGGASAARVVQGDPLALVDEFIAAGQELVRMGCDGITTSCGFLSLVQEELKAALGVPVAASSLMQVPMVQALLPPGQRVGVLTVSAEALTKAHLAAAGISGDVPVEGLEGGQAFSRAILNDAETLDVAACREDMRVAAQALMEQGEIGAIVLECTNMAPYAAEIRAMTGVPVYSIVSFIEWFQAGLKPRVF